MLGAATHTSSSCTCATNTRYWAGLFTFCQCLAEDRFVQGQFRHRLLQPIVLSLQVPQSSGIVGCHVAEAPFPPVVRLLRHLQRSSDLRHRLTLGEPALRLAQLLGLVGHCLSHARRNYVDLHEHFPAEVAHVLTELGKVYAIDAESRDRQMDDAARLRHHQDHSGPVMKALATWLQAQFDERRMEPNSTLGKAIRYMQNHWEQLTLFLRIAGAPLTNDVCERALKRAILHRKNSLFYKTERGAEVGDRFMSLVYTAELSSVNPFEYLVVLLRHAPTVARQPHRWMPWNSAGAVTNETA